MKSDKSTHKISNFPIYLAVILVSFTTLAFLSYRSAFFEIDLQISRAVQSLTNPIFSLIMTSVSALGDGLYLAGVVLAAVALLAYDGLKKEALKAGLFTAISGFTGIVIKHLVSRPRPDGSLVRIQEILLDKSFPSLHVLVFTTFFGYIYYLAVHKVRTIWLKNFIAISAMFLILTVGISRIYLGVHWPSDVLGGYLLGILFISILNK